MVRTPSFDKSGLKKGTWTPEEDRKLITYVTRYGCWNWRQLPRFAGLARCGKSCRLRWMNYLRPNIKRGSFTNEEEEIIIRLHKELGNRWSAIVAHLPGRTDNEIKNHWHTNLKKRFHQNAEAKASKSKDEESKPERVSVPDNGVFQGAPPATSSSPMISQTVPLSPQSSSSQISSISTDHTSNENTVVEDDLPFLDAFTEAVNENFWTEPYLSDISYTQSTEMVPGLGYSINGAFQSQETTKISDDCQFSPQPSCSGSLVVENDLAFLDSPTEPTIENFWTEPYVADMSHVPSELLTPAVTVTEFEYFTPSYDEDLWSIQNNLYLYDEPLSLF